MRRRRALQIASGAGAFFFAARSRAAEAEAAVEKAHGEIWRRFIDPYDVLLDYADFDGTYPCPTPEENREGKPNALSWWTATENGSMFNGMVLDGAVARWQQTRAEADREKARRLVKGLVLLASVGPAGFVARGVASDGKTPPPLGSNDQTGPWLYGMWRAVQAGLVEGREREQVVNNFLEIARVLESSDWRMPCATPEIPFRGTFAPVTWEGAPRLLFMLKAAHDLSGDAHWAELYAANVRERIEVCAGGMVFHKPDHRASWTGASSAIALRGLWELEQDAELKAAYARGLVASARVAAEGVPLSAQYDNDNKERVLLDWRELNQWWRPQHSQAEAVEVAQVQSKELGKRSPRRRLEFNFVREPAFASWVVTLCPDRSQVEPHADAILKTLAHYRYERLYYSQFFPVEAAWWRLRAHRLA